MRKNLVREPDAGDPHVRFDERDLETEQGDAIEAPADERAGNRQAMPKPPRQISTLPNDWDTPTDEIIFSANARCHQENLIEQLKNGVPALRAPVDSLVSNWAYMVMASLAWTLSRWFALLIPSRGRWRKRHDAEREDVRRMEFKRFVNSFILLPCQIVKTGRRIEYRLLGWNRWQSTLFRMADAMRYPLRC